MVDNFGLVILRWRIEMKVALKRIQDEIIEWWKEQTRLGKTITLLFFILAIILCFKYPDPTRNLIFLIAGIVGWYFLNRRTIAAEENTKAAEESAQATIKNTEIAEQGLTVERLTRAMEQLAHEKSYVRVGGIRGLERIAYTEKEDNVKIAQILATFIQTQAAKNSERTRKDIDTYNRSKPENNIDDFSIYRAQRLDIEAAVHALANITLRTLEEYFEEEGSKSKLELCDLRNTDLRGLRLNGINLSGFDFLEADFSHAHLQETDFNRANIGNIKEENMTKFISADLENAIFNNAFIIFADFNHSNLTGAKFHNTLLAAITLDECCINRTNFETSIDLTQEQINKAFYWDNDSPPFLPEGFNLPPQRQSPIPPAPINEESNNPSTKNDEQNS